MRELALPQSWVVRSYGGPVNESRGERWSGSPSMYRRGIVVHPSADDDPARAKYIDEKLRRMREKWRKV